MTRRRERVTSSDYVLSLRFERNVPLIDVTESKPARPEELAWERNVTTLIRDRDNCILTRCGPHRKPSVS